MTKGVLIVLENACYKDVMEKILKEGNMPNIAELAERGFLTGETVGPFNSQPPVGYAAIATGAHPGTSAVSCNTIHFPSEPYYEWHDGCDRRAWKAEPIWEAAERGGKTSIVFMYRAGGWPSMIKNGIAVREPPTIASIPILQMMPLEPIELSDLATFYGEARKQVNLVPASDWKISEKSFSPPLEMDPCIGLNASGGEIGDVLAPQFEPGKRIINRWKSTKPVNYYLLVIDSKGKGYDKVIISPKKDTEKAVAKLSEGEWSDLIKTTFETTRGTVVGYNRFKIVNLSKDGKEFRVYATAISQASGGSPWSKPDSICNKLVEKVGPMPAEGRTGVRTDLNPDALYSLWPWMDPRNEYLDGVREYTRWQSKAAVHLMKNNKWDLFVMGYTRTDMTEHNAWPFIDPFSPWSNSSRFDPKVRDVWWGFLRQIYKEVDDTVGKIVKAAGEDALFVLASTFGKISGGPYQRINICNVLARAGLLKFKEIKGTPTSVEIDWSKTKAYHARATHIYVNLKGREPQGIVEPGEEYEKVRDRIIEALYDVHNPFTGRRLIQLALRNEDAVIIGMGGPYCGDVVFAVGPEGYHNLSHFQLGEGGRPTEDLCIFGKLAGSGVHGWCTPASEYGLGSMKSLLVMSGPRIKKNAKPRDPRIIDIAPTMSEIIGFPTPAQADGRPLFEVLE